MKVNPQDFNREERRDNSWWFSRHPERRAAGDAIRRSRRLTLIDLLLLTVMMGVLVPWFLHMTGGLDLGSYKVDIDSRVRDGAAVITVRISPGRDIAEIENDESVGVILLDVHGDVVFESYDLPPQKGNEREFVFRDNENQVTVCRVVAGSETLSVELTPNGA